MKTLSWVALLGVAVAATWVAYRQQQTTVALRVELTQLSAKLDELQSRLAAAEAKASASAAAATARNDAPLSGAAVADAAEVARLRDEVAALQKQAKEFGRIVQQTQKAAAAQNPTANIPSNLTPIASLKNAGWATPNSAIESIMWAATGGEVDALAQGIGFTGPARAKADAWFASLSDSTRQQYGTPEKLVALMIAKDAASLSGMQVLGQKEITSDDLAMRIRFANDEGKTKDDNFLLHHATDGWKLQLTDAALDKFMRQIGGKK